MSESSHRQVHTGAALEYTAYSTIGATHHLRYECVARDVRPFAQHVSAFIPTNHI